MTDFDIARKDAQDATGYRFLYHKTTGAKRGELVVEEGVGERTLCFGTKVECQKFLEGVAWLANHPAGK